MNIDTLKKTLKDLLRDIESSDGSLASAVDVANITSTLQTILEEVRSSNRERDALKADILKLKTDNTILTETLAQHQRFLEYIDSDKRACNLIITGVSEEDDLRVNDEVSAQSDEGKSHSS